MRAIPDCTIEFDRSDLFSERFRLGIARNIGLILKYEVIEKFHFVADDDAPVPRYRGDEVGEGIVFCTVNEGRHRRELNRGDFLD